MKKSQRFKLIVDLNSENEKKLLEEIARIQTKKQLAQDQIDSLQQYKQEYNKKYDDTCKAGVNVASLMEYRAFISKLDKAIEGQSNSVLEIDNELSVTRKTWERQHHKTSNLKKIYKSTLANETRAEDKREQKELDDRASQMGRNNGTKSVFN